MTDTQIIENNEIKSSLLNNQDFDDNNLITKKFTLNKEIYKNLTLMALDKFYDVDMNKLNTMELTSNLLNEIIIEAYNKYKQEKFK
jgi:hypothetical protein